MIDDLQKRARMGRKAAAEASARDTGDWYSAEKKKLAALELEPEEFARRRNDLLREFGKRGIKAEARAKYQNSLTKIVEREAIAAYDRKKPEAGNP